MDNNTSKDISKITTVKLQTSTKERMEHLRIYKRETYDEIVQKMLDILNTCRISPEAARRKLIDIDRAKRKTNKENRVRNMMTRKQITGEQNGNHR